MCVSVVSMVMCRHVTRRVTIELGNGQQCMSSMWIVMMYRDATIRKSTCILHLHSKYFNDNIICPPDWPVCIAVTTSPIVSMHIPNAALMAVRHRTSLFDSLWHIYAWERTWEGSICQIEHTVTFSSHTNSVHCTIKPGLYFERKSTPYTQTILRTWSAYSRPPMPIYAAVIAQMPSINTPTTRRLLRWPLPAFWSSADLETWMLDCHWLIACDICI